MRTEKTKRLKWVDTVKKIWEDTFFGNEEQWKAYISAVAKTELL